MIDISGLLQDLSGVQLTSLILRRKVLSQPKTFGVILRTNPKPNSIQELIFVGLLIDLTRSTEGLCCGKIFLFTIKGFMSESDL